jgi:hypothetical protein
METKLLEIRDRATFIATFAVNMNAASPEERYLLRREGYTCSGLPNIAIAKLGANIDDRFCNDPFAWGGRTFPVAHRYIIEHWDELKNGDVIDVEFILGETTTKKVSERVTEPDDDGNNVEI